MHIWETTTLDNVAYILKRPDFADLNPVKFFILRGDETLYGYLRWHAPKRPSDKASAHALMEPAGDARAMTIDCGRRASAFGRPWYPAADHSWNAT